MPETHLHTVERTLAMLDEQVGVPEIAWMPQTINQGIIFAIKELHEAVRLLRLEVLEP